MGRQVSILFVCGAGLGSSFAAQMAAEDVLNAHGVDAKLDHVDISTAASSQTDIIITAQNFRSQFEKFSIDEEKTAIVYLKISSQTGNRRKASTNFRNKRGTVKFKDSRFPVPHLPVD